MLYPQSALNRAEESVRTLEELAKSAVRNSVLSESPKWGWFPRQSQTKSRSSIESQTKSRSSIEKLGLVE
ncbi:hypothetical protein BC936DRAFT_142746 [Jimgerdemannia flammicorona]|uniref:Uncharacterized protein n=1 Tax=Jimgerdemannia flammicorona TaxID=994334 RepID=A0A432ZZW1_9FUNG|nr:hypothetical protein BC936DRAFT_142746 [Jimgerdemannia flammicorona]